MLEAGRATLELLDEAQAATVDAIEAGSRVAGLERGRIASKTGSNRSHPQAAMALSFPASPSLGQ